LIDLIFWLLPVLPWVVLWLIVRHGPIRNRWWQGENVLGFALFVGTVGFLIGFVGPMIFAPRANQGPMLGIFYTGPISFIAGLAWGLWRAMRRRN
jgi:hypothetical protein